MIFDLKNLKNLVRHGEGQRLEFKMKVKFPEKIIKELVAFANTDGGHLLLGCQMKVKSTASSLLKKNSFY